MKRLLTVVFIFAVLLSVAFAQRTSTTLSGREFVIDENKAYVYLLFDHVGVGARYGDNEPTTRIWFRLVNNCRVPVTVRKFGTPEGSAAGEVGLMHDVVPNVSSGSGGIKAEFPAPLSDVKKPSPPLIPAPERVPMPTGYIGDVSSVEVIHPKESLLFSIPITHLSKDWHIEIPYGFELPRGKCCRPANVGGQPQMFLFYSASDLPDEVQRKLPRKK